MRRTLQVLGLSGLLATGFASQQAFAQDAPEPDQKSGTAADTEHNTEEPKEAEKPAPVFAPATTAPETAPPPFAPPAPRPKFGDLSISGYFRGGFGAIIKESADGMTVGGRQTCFSLPNPAGLVAKYRLGNECEVWSETHFSIVTYAGDDGVVSTLHFMPTVFIPTTNIGYSPNGTVNSPAIFTTSTGATVSFPNLYVDIKNIPWLYGGTAWAGTRYYKREFVYINDFFYWNPSGVGAGVEDVNLGAERRLSLGLFAVDGEPGMPTDVTAPQLPSQLDFGVRIDLQLRGLTLWEGGELQLGAQYIADYSNHVDANGASVTHGGWGVTMQLVQAVLGGNNKLAVQYGKGGGTGFGTLSRFYYPDFSLYYDPSEYRFRALDVLTIQPIPTVGGQFVAIYQRDQNFLGVQGQNTNWYSAGGRVGWAVLDHFKLVGEVGYDRIVKSNGSDPQELYKITIAPTIAAAKSFMSRPELRLFYTWARWNETARGASVEPGMVYRSTQFLSGSTVGLQAETWY